MNITPHTVESSTPPVIEGEYIITVSIARGVFVSCESDQAIKNDKAYPPTPTNSAYLSVLGKTFLVNTVSFVSRDI